MSYRDTIKNKESFIKLYHFTLSLPKAQSVMLSYLIDSEGSTNVNRLPEDKRFFQTNQRGFIDRMLTGWSTTEIRNALNSLAAGGYIEKKIVMRGMTKATYIRLIPEAIDALSRDYESKHLEKINEVDEQDIETDDILDETIQDSNIEEAFKASPEPKKKTCKKKEADPNKSKKYQNLMDYIESLGYPPQAADGLKKWYVNQAAGKVSVGQLRDKLEKLAIECNYNMNDMSKAIENSYLNGWMGFFKPKSQSYGKPIPKQVQPTITVGTQVERKEFILDD